MPAYLISHPGGKRDDILIEDPHLTLDIHHGWAIFSDNNGPCLALSPARDATIQRIDPPDPGNQPDEEPTPGR